MEILKPIVSAVGTMEPMLMIVMLVLLAVIVMAWYYLTKIHPRNQEIKAQHDEKMLEIEERRSKDQAKTNLYLRDASLTQQQLLTQNTEAVKNLKDFMEKMSDTFLKVSERLAIHYANSAQANRMIADMHRDMPTQTMMTEMKGVLHEMAKEALDKEDVDQILGEIHKLQNQVDKLGSTLSEIKMRQIGV
jgi:CRISPR/Cas system CMR subunit Cmr6 (Cas7 group RAMP superfamily)